MLIGLMINCIYIENLTAHFPNINFEEVCDSNFFTIDIQQNEHKHLKALRIKQNEKILITNGQGIIALAMMELISKTSYKIRINKIIKQFNELPFRLGLAIGMLTNKERFEFAIEKCTELGVTDIFPIISDFSQTKNINYERIKSKTIAAITQCKRSCLPKIHSPISTVELIKSVTVQGSANYFDLIILADENGIQPTKQPNNLKDNKNIIAFIGCEGGFSERELNNFPIQTIKWNLGNRRLRAETAAILTIGILSLQ